MSSVRALLALIFVFLLPLQLTFAAGAEYCETGRSHASHFGHHGHAAQDGEGEADSDSDDGKSPAKNCSFCHMGCSHIQASSYEFIAVRVPPRYVADDPRLPFGIPPQVPELPPRSLLA